MSCPLYRVRSELSMPTVHTSFMFRSCRKNKTFQRIKICGPWHDCHSMYGPQAHYYTITGHLPLEKGRKQFYFEKLWFATWEIQEGKKEGTRMPFVARINSPHVSATTVSSNLKQLCLWLSWRLSKFLPVLRFLLNVTWRVDSLTGGLRLAPPPLSRSSCLARGLVSTPLTNCSTLATSFCIDKAPTAHPTQQRALVEP